MPTHAIQDRILTSFPHMLMFVPCPLLRALLPLPYADAYVQRGGRTIELKKTVDEAIANIPVEAGGPSLVSTVFCFERVERERSSVVGRDVWMSDILKKQRPYCPPEAMDSEDTLFFLYTSGSTGKPKGLAHTQAGLSLCVLVVPSAE